MTFKNSQKNIILFRINDIEPSPPETKKWALWLFGSVPQEVNSNNNHPCLSNPGKELTKEIFLQ